MSILLTGATGYIGSAILTELLASGQRVTAVVRSADAARSVQRAGATALHGDLSDRPWLAARLREHDGAVHAAAPGDATAADLDRAVTSAAVDAYATIGKPFLHTGGIWSYGAGDDITEHQRLDPPALTAWRMPIEDALLGEGMNASVIVPAIVYGHGAGIPRILRDLPRTDGAATLIGTGAQHWATVHVDDLARLYALVLRLGRPVGRLIAAGGDNPTVADLVAAAAPGVPARETTRAEVHAMLGEGFGDALLLSQQATAARARALGWRPQHRTLVEELASGSYAASPAA